MSNFRATFGTVWTFKAGRFLISLELERDYNYRYDGDDEDGETQALLDRGEFVAFDSAVIVELDGEEIARDTLSGSVYHCDNVAEFYVGHRDPDPMNRNCSIMRASRGENVAIGHCFPDMVQAAIAEARAYVRGASDLPYIREGA